MNDSSVNTKIKAMRGKLLTHKNYSELAKSKTVEEVAEKLKKFPGYRKIIEVEKNKIHRGNIESKLALILMSDFERIYNFIPDFKIRKYMSAFFMRHEIHILKLILCMIYDKRNIEYTLPELNSLIGSKLNIDAKKLKSSSSVEDFINNLQGTDFYELLSKSYNQSHNLFDLEMKLDLYYHTHLQKLQKNLSGRNKNILQKLRGIESDLTNITWIYRIKKYYNFDPAAIFSCLIPVRYKLTSKEISSLVKSNTINEFKNVVRGTYYKNLFSGTDELKIEHAFYDFLAQEYYKFYLRSKNDISAIVYHIYLKQLELNNITSIIEGVRYGLDEKKIMQYLYLIHLK